MNPISIRAIASGLISALLITIAATFAVVMLIFMGMGVYTDIIVTTIYLVASFMLPGFVTGFVAEHHKILNGLITGVMFVPLFTIAALSQVTNPSVFWISGLCVLAIVCSAIGAVAASVTARQ